MRMVAEWFTRRSAARATLIACGMVSRSIPPASAASARSAARHGRAFA